MVSISIFVLFTFLYIFSELFNDNLAQKEKILFTDFAASMQKEFTMAGDASLGYSRSFIVPVTVEGFHYNIWNTRNSLVINYSKGQLGLVIPDTNGTIIIGANTIENTNGTICINC
jgi:hypothetical protein